MVIAVVIPDRSAANEYSVFMETAIRKLAAVQPMHRFCFFSAAPPNGGTANEEWIRKPCTAKMLSRWWYYNVRLPGLLKKTGAGLFLATEGYTARTTCPQCLVWPQVFFAFSNSSYLSIRPGATHIKKAQAFAVFSGTVKASLEEQYQLPSEKTVVVHAAVAADFVPLDSEAAQVVRDQVAGGTAYFLCTGLRRHGSLLMLLKAFSQFKKRQKSSMKLVVAASAADHVAMNQQLAGYRFRQDVVLLHAGETGEEARLYGAAYAVVGAASGTGTTLVKALHCQVPVLTVEENRSFAQEAALYFQDQQQLAEQMMLVYKDENLRSRVIENGKHLASLHTWQNCTAELWQCMKPQ